MKRLLGVVASLAIAVSIVPSADALCIAMEAGDVLASPVAAVLPGDGGILVRWMPVSEVKAENQSSGWKVAAEGTSVAVARIQLAPGLTVLRPAAGTAMLTVSSGTTEIARLTRDATLPAFTAAAPTPTKLALTTQRARYSGYFRTVSATLSAPVPDDAIGVITYATRKKKRVAISFALVERGKLSVATFGDPGRCSFGPPGADAPKTGEKVTLVWVDAFGRLSKPSAPIAMTGSVPKTK